MFDDLIVKKREIKDFIYAPYIPLQKTSTPVNNIKDARKIIAKTKGKWFTVEDMNGVEIKAGQTVMVYQEEEIRVATVIEVFSDRPTGSEPGFWVDIDFGDGVQGMMSYILRVV